MKIITTTILQSEDLSQMLQSPVVRSSDKKAVLASVFKNTNIATSNLIDTLISNKRLALLSDVAAGYIQLYDQMRGTQVATSWCSVF